MKKQIKFTAAKNQCSVLIFALLAGVLGFGLCQTLPAQITRPNPRRVKPTPTPKVKQTPPTERKVIVIKGPNVQQRQPELEFAKNRPPTKALTQAEKEILFKKVLSTNGMVLEQPVKIMPFAFLTTRNPYVENKAYITFYDALEVNGTWNKTIFSTNGGNFKVTIKPTKKGQWFLVDCYLTSEKTARFQITPNGQREPEYIGDYNYLTILLQANDLFWQGFDLSWLPPAGPPNIELNFKWTFHSCEVTEGFSQLKN